MPHAAVTVLLNFALSMAEDLLMSRFARHSDFAPLSFRDKPGAFGNNLVVGRKT